MLVLVKAPGGHIGRKKQAAFMTLIQLLEQGGIFMIPLLLGSLLTVAVCVERAVYFASLQAGSTGFLQRLQALVSQGSLSEAGQWLRGLRGPVPTVALAAIDNWSGPRQTVEDHVVARIRTETPTLFRYLNLLETVVTASPLIGLLGTITGMMGVFRAVSLKMASNPNADTGGILAGIGEALIATACGICLAVFSLLAHNFFQAMAERQLEAAERVADGLLLAHNASQGARA